MDREKILLEKIETEPDELEHYSDLLDYYDEKGEFDNAINLYKELIEKLEKDQFDLNQDEKKELLACYYLDLASILGMFMEFDDSDQYLEKIDLNFLDKELQSQFEYYKSRNFFLGKIQRDEPFSEAQLKEGAQWAEASLDLCESEIDQLAMYELATRFFAKLGEIQKTDELAREALELVEHMKDFKDEDAFLIVTPLLNAGEAYLLAKDCVNAISFLNLAIEKAGKTQVDDSLMFAVFVRLGQAYYLLNDIVNCLVYFRKALEINPEDEDLQKWIQNIEDIGKLDSDLENE